MIATRKSGSMWQPDNKEEKQADLVTRLDLAIAGFQKRWGDIMPRCCFTSEELPDDMPDTVIPVYHGDAVTPHHLWLEFPEGFDFREAGKMTRQQRRKLHE